MSPQPTIPGGMDTYEKLVETIGDWLGRSDLNEKIPDFIRLTEADLSRSLNLREQETSTTGNLILDQEWIQMPDDLQIPRQLMITGSSAQRILVQIVSIHTFQAISQAYEATGADPMSACHIGDRLYLSPAPNSVDEYILFYLGRLMPLSSNNSTNRLLKDAPDALLYGSLMHSAPYIGDDARGQMWSAMYGNFKEDYRKFEWNARMGGGPLRVRADQTVDDRHTVGAG